LIMPFGKYKGDYVFNLPDNYLIWLRAKLELREPLKTHVVNEIEARGLIPARCGTLDQAKVKNIYRELSLMFHPDRGGNTEAQKAVNLFYERLLEVIVTEI
jgi:hypothetical protein